MIGCISSPLSSPPTSGPAENQPIPRGPLYTGAGGKNTKIAVLQPQGENLAQDELWLSAYIQGTLTSYFSKFTAMTIIDRQNLDKIIDNQDFSTSGYFSEDDYISIGNISNAEYILIGSLRKIPQDNSFMLDLSVSHAGTGQRIASFTPSICTFGDIQRASIIQKAFEDISGQLGVILTEYGKQSLYGISNTEIAAETLLSKGIVAQKNNRIGEALSYYYNAASFSPAMPEVKGRISNLSSSVSSGSLGENFRNLIAWRNAWYNVLKECDSFLENHIPFEIVYDTDLKQEGKINYDAGTIDLSFSLLTRPTDGFKMINDVLKGLKKTRRQEEWGFQFWPFKYRELDFSLVYDLSIRNWDTYEGIINTNHYQWSEFRERITLPIEFDLINESGNILSSVNSNIRCNMGSSIFVGKHGYTQMLPKEAKVKPESNRYELVFKNVNVNQITDSMIIKIVTVNDIDAETAISNGYIKISTGKI
jgi:hypothetical protein